MRRLLYVCGALAILSGCGAEEPVTSTEVVVSKPEEPAPAPVTQEAPPQPQPVLVDVKAIANKSEKEVASLLGQPTETEKGGWTLYEHIQDGSEKKTPYVLNIYAHKSGTIEVMFIEGKAARISFNPKGDLRYPDDAIEAMEIVGLAAGDRSTPDFEAPHYIRYDGVSDFFYVDVISDMPDKPERIRQIKIVTEEKYK